MVSARDPINTARERIHRNRAVNALYVYGSADPIEISVRVHDKYKTVEGIPGGFATSLENATSLLLLNSEFETKPANGAYISLSETEAYAIVSVHPPHGITTEVEVSRLTAAQITAYSVPAPEAE